MALMVWNEEFDAVMLRHTETLNMFTTFLLLQVEHTTGVANSVFQQDQVVREKYMRRLNNTDFLEGENHSAVSIFNKIHSSRLKISNFVLSIKVSIRRSKKRKFQKTSRRSSIDHHICPQPSRSFSPSIL